MSRERAPRGGRVARHIGSRHHALMLSPDHVLDAFDHWIDVFDEPFADQAALPTMLLAGYARQHVTVVLTGEGADEVFGGYANYRKRVREERYVRWLAHPASPVPALVRRCRARAQGSPAALDRRAAARGAIGPSPTCSTRCCSRAAVAALFAATARIAGHRRLRGAGLRRMQLDQYLDRLLHVDTRLWLPDDLLTKVDRATMTHSLEARVPYLDHRLVEFCARLDGAEDPRRRRTSTC